MLKGMKGFTLVELILVVLIIGILAGVVIPRINYTADEARLAAANATVQGVNATLEYAHARDEHAYSSDILSNTEYFPDGNPADSMPTGYALSWNGSTSRFYREP